MKRILFVFIFLILAINVNAEIRLARDSYWPGETVQAEINLDVEPERDLTINNFELVKDNENVPIAFFFKKISEQNYYIYFDLPNNLEERMYKFRIKGIYYLKDNVLKTTNEEKEFEVKKINKGYSYLLEQKSNDNWGNVINTALSSIVLKRAGYNVDDTIKWLELQQDAKGCFPKDNCKVKDTAFALLALNEFGKDDVKAKNWLIDAQNKFDIGTWELKLTGSDGTCKVDNSNVNIVNGEAKLSISKAEVYVNCSSIGTINAELKHSYLGIIYEGLFARAGNEFWINITNNECYGESYKSNCNFEASSYASWVLNKLFNKEVSSWLENNVDDTKTFDQAFIYLLKKKDYSLNWLENNKIEYTWPVTSTSNEKDVYTTSIVYLSLKNNNTKYWLGQQNDVAILSTAMKLYSAFDEKTRKVISISPGFIDSSDEILRLISKSGNISVNIDVPTGVDIGEDNFIFDNRKDINVLIKNDYRSGDLIIRYDNLSYEIPILIKVEEITKEEGKIQFITKTSEGKLYLNKNESKDISIDFKNNLNYSLKDVKVKLSGNLDEIIQLTTETFSTIKSKEEKTILLKINKNKKPKLDEYSGELIVSSGTESASFPIKISFKAKEEQIVNKTGIVNQTGGKAKRSWWKVVITFLVIILIGAVIFYLKFRGKKEVSMDEYVRGLGKKHS